MGCGIVLFPRRAAFEIPTGAGDIRLQNRALGLLLLGLDGPRVEHGAAKIEKNTLARFVAEIQ